MRANNAGKNNAIEYKIKLTKAPESVIHQKVGIRNTAQMEPASMGGACVSAAPRAGSCSMSSSGTKRSAGAAATIIAARHPNFKAIGPVKKKLSAPPTGTPSIKSASGFERRSAGNRPQTKLVGVGAAVPPPTPTPRRIIKKKK